VTFDIEGIPVSTLTVDLGEPGLPGLEDLVQRIAALVGLPAVA